LKNSIDKIGARSIYVFLGHIALTENFIFSEPPHPKGLPAGKSAAAEWGIND
jgi:hypothetical protein